MSGDSATLALSTGTTIFNALDAAEQASTATQVATARAEAQARQIEAAAEAQALSLGRQAGVRQFQAQQLTERAKLTRARLALRKAQERREGRRRQSKRELALASRGTTLRGSPTDVLADTAAEEALNLAILEFEGQTAATQAEQGAVLRRHEANLLGHEAGLARAMGQRRADFVRRNAAAGGTDPFAAGLASGVSTAVNTGLPEMVGQMLAGGPDTVIPATQDSIGEIEAGTGNRAFPRRRSRFQRSLLQ